MSTSVVVTLMCGTKLPCPPWPTEPRVSTA